MTVAAMAFSRFVRASTLNYVRTRTAHVSVMISTARDHNVRGRRRRGSPQLARRLSLSAPVRHVHPERLDPRDDALGDDARGRPVVAPHAVRRRVGDEAPRLLEREEDAAAR